MKSNTLQKGDIIRVLGYRVAFEVCDVFEAPGYLAEVYAVSINHGKDILVSIAKCKKES